MINFETNPDNLDYFSHLHGMSVTKKYNHVPKLDSSKRERKADAFEYYLHFTVFISGTAAAALQIVLSQQVTETIILYKIFAL